MTGRPLSWRDRAALCADLDIDAEKLKTWQRQGLPLPPAGERIPVAGIARWLAAQRRPPGRPAETGDSVERLRAAQAAWAETKTARLRGDLISRDVVQRWLSRHIEDMRQVLRRAAREAGRRVVGQAADEAGDFIEDALLGALEAFADAADEVPS